MSRSSHDNAAKALLGAVAFALRAAAWLLVALVVADLFLTGPARAALLPLNTWLARALPEGRSGSLVLTTPLGGAFRGDFALVAVVLFVVDWAICKIAASLR